MSKCERTEKRKIKNVRYWFHDMRAQIGWKCVCVCVSKTNEVKFIPNSWFDYFLRRWCTQDRRRCLNVCLTCIRRRFAATVRRSKWNWEFCANPFLFLFFHFPINDLRCTETMYCMRNLIFVRTRTLQESQTNCLSPCSMHHGIFYKKDVLLFWPKCVRNLNFSSSPKKEQKQVDPVSWAPSFRPKYIFVQFKNRKRLPFHWRQ